MKTSRSVIFALISALCSGCGAGALEKLLRAPQLVAQQTSNASFKTLDPDVIANRYRFLFILDVSGSNGSGPGGGSDPTGARRFDNVVKFVQSQQATLGNDTGYALEIFSNGPTLIQNFTTDAPAFLTITEAAKAGTYGSIASGSTDFSGAFAKALATIQQDVTNCMADPNSPGSFYIVFHISDGVPQIGTGLEDWTTQIKPVEDSILAMGQGNSARCVNGVVMHTGYYYSGTADPNAQLLMQEIATEAKGQFIDFGADQQIDLSEFEIPAIKVQMKLADVLISNINTVWENGVLKLDSDGDGLSDDFEALLGSDPGKRDSDDNGISDYVEFKVYGTPCGDRACNALRARDLTTQCAPYLLTPPGTQPVIFKDTDGDGLNDCEEQLLGSRPDRWDSNGNWIPDRIEFLAGMNFIPGAHEENQDPDNDGLTNAQEVKLGTPITVANGSLVNFKPYDYTLSAVGTDGGRTIYNVDVKSIPTIGNGNHVRIYILENSIGTKDLRFMRIAEKIIPPNGVLSFSDSDFGQPYKFECTPKDPCY